MIKIMRFTFVVLLLLQLPVFGITAAPDPPFEDYLLRAETVFIGRMVDRTDKEVSFEIIELLRGQSDEATNLRQYAIDNEGFVSKENPTWLVISQGDNHYGKPKQIVSFGGHLDGQCCYRGWIAFPIKGTGDEAYIDHVFTLVDKKEGEPLAKLRFNKAKILIQRFPYKPDIHDAQPNNSFDRSGISLPFIRED